MTQKTVLFALVTALSLASPTVLAQTQGQGQGQVNREQSKPDKFRRPKQTQEIVRLEHLNAHDVVKLVRSLWPQCRIGAEYQTNSVVIIGAIGHVEMAVDQLRRLDAGAGEQKNTRERSALIRLDREATGELMRMIGTVAGSTQVAFDSETGMLVARGPANEIDEIQQLIQALKETEDADDASATDGVMQVSFFFIQGRLGNADTEIQRDAANEDDVEDREGSAEEDAIWAKLGMPIAVSFDEVALKEAIDTIAKLGKFSTMVIWSDLESAGIDRDWPVTLTVHSKMPLEQVLQAVLEQAAGQGVELGFAVSENIVKIATQSLLDRNVRVAVYDIQDLLPLVPSEAEPPSVLPPGDASEVGKNDKGKPKSVSGCTFAGSLQNTLAEDLLDAIRDTIKPTSWDWAGGTVGSARIVGKGLVVKQTEAAHDAIAELLEELKEQQAAIRSAAFTPLPPMLEPVGAALAESGFHHPSLLAPFTVFVQNDEEYEVFSRASQAGGDIQIEIQGHVERLDGNVAELEVEAILSRPTGKRSIANDETTKLVFRIRTSLQARLGDLVVLAVSPGDTGYGQTIALAVRITTAD